MGEFFYEGVTFSQCRRIFHNGDANSCAGRRFYTVEKNRRGRITYSKCRPRSVFFQELVAGAEVEGGGAILSQDTGEVFFLSILL